MEPMSMIHEVLTNLIENIEKCVKEKTKWFVSWMLKGEKINFIPKKFNTDWLVDEWELPTWLMEQETLVMIVVSRNLIVAGTGQELLVVVLEKWGFVH